MQNSKFSNAVTKSCEYYILKAVEANGGSIPPAAFSSIIQTAIAQGLIDVEFERRDTPYKNKHRYKLTRAGRKHIQEGDVQYALQKQKAHEEAPQVLQEATQDTRLENQSVPQQTAPAHEGG